MNVQNMNANDLLLYAVTDRVWIDNENDCKEIDELLKDLNIPELENVSDNVNVYEMEKCKKLSQQVKKSLDGGATFMQLREKNLSAKEFEIEGKIIKALCSHYSVPFVINDDVELAIKIGADGVHVGQNDMMACDVRKLIGKDMILGVSAQTVEQAVEAEKNGANYLGVGAIFSTDTKKDADDVSIETLEEICRAVKIPVIAIGGITAENLEKLSQSGIVGVAVVSAIFAGEDIKKDTETLLEKCKEVFK